MSDYTAQVAEYRGKVGEEIVSRTLSRFDRNRFIVLNNLLLPKTFAREDEVPTTQIDHIVISVFGVFCIETKNYTGYIYGRESSEEWKYYLGRQEHFLQNPLRQNHGHVKTLQKILEKGASQIGTQNSYYPIIPIVAFSDQAILKIECDANVTHFSQLKDLIIRYCKKEYLTPEQVENMAAYIVSLNIYSEENMRHHVDYINALKTGTFKNEYAKPIMVGSVPPEMETFDLKSWPSQIVEENQKNQDERYEKAKLLLQQSNLQRFRSENPNVLYKVGGMSPITIMWMIIGICAVALLPVALFAMLLLDGCSYGSQNKPQPITQNSQPQPTVSTPVQAKPIPGTKKAAEAQESKEPVLYEEEKNITYVGETLYSPRTNVENDIVYIHHGSSHGKDRAFTDADGVLYEEWIELYFHEAFGVDQTYIDIDTDNYTQLSFTYTSGQIYYENRHHRITVYDRDTGEALYEADPVTMNHSVTANVDIAGHPHIRMQSYDDASSMVAITNIILSNP